MPGAIGSGYAFASLQPKAFRTEGLSFQVDLEMGEDQPSGFCHGWWLMSQGGAQSSL